MSKQNRNNRWKCPRCGGKKVKALNKTKEELILECRRRSCQAKWHIPKGTNIKMRLGDKDIKYVEKKNELPKEIKEIVEAPPIPAQELVDLGSLSLGSKN